MHLYIIPASLCLLSLQGFGELHKSSTTPMEVKALEGIYILQVSCGLGHTLLIAKDQSEQDKAKLMKLPEFMP